MDLLRAAKTAFEINKPFDSGLCAVFLNKSIDEFEKHLPNEAGLKAELVYYSSQLDSLLEDPLIRIRWGEKVMTIASRLGTS